MKAENRKMKKGNPIELVYIQCASAGLKDEDSIVTIAVKKDDIINRNGPSENMLTDDNPGYMRILKEQFCEISIPADAHIFYCEETDAEEIPEEADGINEVESEEEVLAETFVMKLILGSEGENLDAVEGIEITENGDINYTTAFECEGAMFHDEADLRMFRISIDCTEQVITFRERIVPPEISGIQISDPCFTLVDSFNEEGEEQCCTLDCENCSLNCTANITL